MRWLALLLCLPVAGCGFGEGATRGDVSLTVTRNFGAERLHEGIDEETAEEGDTVMRLLQENYEVETRYGGGFVQEVEIEELCELAVPLIDDVGSGNLAEQLPALAEEPPVRRSVAAGAALVCFSGDKLLGGPQAGLLVGRADAIAAARAHPLARALRLDKLSLAALEATLALYSDPERARAEIPVLAMLTADEAALTERARRLARM